ncbi:MAG: hypothetical protein CVU46_15485 [Chloroflexi bacterium HGW-Chloroflexi-8]|nr:MAG: hypothetical protein CVU46_15485 [Chloroflexi bacterium HGW-Chloroflexi-8]
MITHGLSSLSEFLGDRVVYRNLDVQDRSLPRLKAIVQKIGLPENRIPRKAELAYGQIVATLLQMTCEIDHPGQSILNLVFIGDTRMNDGTAFVNICKSGKWNGIAFIASEKDPPENLNRDPGFEFPLYIANRWSLLNTFEDTCRKHDIEISTDTAVVFDLDKTSLGARGRNDAAIDNARTQAAEDVVREILGADFDLEVFSRTYAMFNQVEFHSFTTDNQDYLVYLCLLATAGVIDSDRLTEQVRSGSLRSFEAFANIIQARQPEMPVAIKETQADFFLCLQKGDPTPFKAFRRREYINTVTAMRTPPAFDVEQLNHTICITEEVRQFALFCISRGALLFGLSDKPDEASLPGEELAMQGYRPLHRTPMLSVSLK